MSSALARQAAAHPAGTPAAQGRWAPRPWRWGCTSPAPPRARAARSCACQSARGAAVCAASPARASRARTARRPAPAEITSGLSTGNLTQCTLLHAVLHHEAHVWNFHTNSQAKESGQPASFTYSTPPSRFDPQAAFQCLHRQRFAHYCMRSHT